MPGHARTWPGHGPDMPRTCPDMARTRVRTSADNASQFANVFKAQTKLVAELIVYHDIMSHQKATSNETTSSRSYYEPSKEPLPKKEHVIPMYGSDQSHSDDEEYEPSKRHFQNENMMSLSTDEIKATSDFAS